jgi:hypothetical protein
MRAPRAPRCASIGALCLCLCALESVATAAAPAVAESLYQEGRDLATAGRTAEACAKFAESYRLDPATGTLLNLAACNESLGKYATAWAEFRTALPASRHANREDRAQFASEHLARLEKLLSYVMVRVQGPLGLVQVTLDGVRLEQAAWNVRLPVDPGPHQIVATRRAGETTSYPFVVHTGAPDLTVDVGEGLAPRRSTVSPEPPALDGAGQQRRHVGFAVLGASAAIIAVGGYFGWRAYSKWDEHEQICASAKGCPGATTEPGADARTAARASDILLATGVAGGITAAVLLYLAHRAGPSGRMESTTKAPGVGIVQPSVTSAGAGLVWSRDW